MKSGALAPVLSSAKAGVASAATAAAVNARVAIKLCMGVSLGRGFGWFYTGGEGLSRTWGRLVNCRQR